MRFLSNRKDMHDLLTTVYYATIKYIHVEGRITRVFTYFFVIKVDEPGLVNHELGMNCHVSIIHVSLMFLRLPQYNVSGKCIV